MESYERFYELIEIVKNYLDASLDVEKFPTKRTKGKKTHWQNRMREWMKEHYEYDGIIKNEKFKQLIESKF